MAKPEAKDIYPLHRFTEDFAGRVKRRQDIRYCFVIGSGASSSSGIPTGAAMMDEWLRLRFEQDCPKSGSDEIVPWAEETFKNWSGFTWANRAAFFGQIYDWYFPDTANGLDELRQVIRGKSPSFGYGVLAKILANTNHKVVLTTNFDNLLRDAIQLHVPGEVIYTGSGPDDARYLAGHANRIRIAKLHGDIEGKTYHPAPGISQLHDVWDESLRGIFMYYTPIFIGYSGNDAVVQYIDEQLDMSRSPARPVWAYRVDPEAMATSGNGDPVRPGWPESEAVRELMQKHQGIWLPIPGFDEFMMLLGYSLEYGNQAPLIRGEADRRAQNYERSLAEAGKALRMVRCQGWCPQLAELAALAERKLLGREYGRTWNEWRITVEAAPLRTEKKRLLEDATRELKNNPELKAYHAMFLAEEKATAPEVDALIQEAKFLAEKSAGAESPAMCTVLFHLAWIYELRSQSTEALKIAESVLRQRKALLGDEHPDTQKTMHLMAIALSHQGNYVGAEQQHRQVLEIRERTLGREHPDTLGSMNNLANTLSDQANYVAAEKLHRRVLEARERVLGKEHPDTFKSINNLANALSGQGNYGEAEKLHLRVLDARERTLGREHPDTFSSLTNLANVFFDQRNYAEAERLYRQTLEIQERTLGLEHEGTLGSVNNLALALTQQGNYPEAEQLHRRALEVYERTLGKDHPNTVRSRRNLSGVLARQDPRKQ